MLLASSSRLIVIVYLMQDTLYTDQLNVDDSKLVGIQSFATSLWLIARDIGDVCIVTTDFTCVTLRCIVMADCTWHWWCNIATDWCRRPRRRRCAAGVFVMPPPTTKRWRAADVVPAWASWVYFPLGMKHINSQFIHVSANAAFRDSHFTHLNLFWNLMRSNLYTDLNWTYLFIGRSLVTWHDRACVILILIMAEDEFSHYVL